MRLLLVLAAVCACGGGRGAGSGGASTPVRPASTVERMLALLPEGAQVLVELDLARLRANQVVGGLATQALGQLGADAHVPGLPVAVQGSPLANADVVVLAAYGVGTAQATTLILLATHEEVPDATRLSPEFVVLGAGHPVVQQVDVIQPDQAVAVVVVRDAVDACQ